MSDYIETPEDIEELEGAEFDMVEDQIDQELENAEKELEGMGDVGALGRVRRVRRKTRKSRSKRRSSRKSSAKRSYSAGKKAASVPTSLKSNMTSRGEMMMRFSELPKEVLAKLKSKDLQLVDQALFAIKDVDNISQIDMFQPSDDKKQGVTNLNRAMLPNGEYFLLSAIVLEYAHGTVAQGGDPAVEDPTLYNFGQNALPAEVINGTIEMQQGSTTILPEISCGMFDDNDSTKRAYLYRLSNPKLLKPNQEITPTVNLVKAVADDIHAPALKITLIGTSIVKA